MSKHRIKNVLVDDDVYDDYEDDEGEQEETETLSVEDKEQLRSGTLQVRDALAGVPATDNEIKEALWHYYYDVGKSVAYLKNKRKPATTQKSNIPASTKIPSADSKPCSAPISAKGFFDDCPWFGISPHRTANILIEPLYPRLGLLGGSPSSPPGVKMSKLAALAAKRRQKENEKITTGRSDEPNPQDKHNPSPSTRRPSHPSPPELLEKTVREDRLDAHNLDRTRSDPDNIPIPKAVGFEDQPRSIEANAEVAKASTDLEPATAIRGYPSPFAVTIMPHEPATVYFQSNLEDDIAGVMGFSEPRTKPFDFTDPSPDDLVTKAQSSKAAPTNVKPAAKQNNAAKKNNAAKTKADISDGVRNLSVEEAVKIGSRNLDVLAEYKIVKQKSAANFVVIGHVDAGKSTLMGRLLFDLGAIDQRTLDKYKKEAERIGKGSFAFAWVLDQGSEERARGVTIDIATNKFETDKTSFTILDAPGHRDFVPNMIAGASQADFAVLVIDASTGNFESGLKGQTKEHALLVRSMGVQRIIVAVNKMDIAEWAKGRFHEIEQQMSGFLTTAGFQPQNMSFIPCSGLHGDNILRRSSDAKSAWYTGRTVVEELDTSEPIKHAVEKPLRMTIGDVFRGGVQNPLSVSGRLEAGSLQTGDQVLIMPSAEKAFVRSLEVDDEPRDWAVAGQNAVLHLTDIDQMHLKTGDMLCSTTSPVKSITSFTAKVLAFEHLTPMNIDIHRGRLHVPGKISQLVAILDKADGNTATKKRPKIVQPGSVVRLKVEMDQSVPLPEASRIILRANGETVAAGLIE